MNSDSINKIYNNVFLLKDKVCSLKEYKGLSNMDNEIDSMLYISKNIYNELEYLKLDSIKTNYNGKEFKLDYFSKYYFYEECEFKNSRDDADFILEQIKLNGRYDIDGHSFTFSKYNNIVESITKTNVNFSVILASENVIIDNEEKHLDLNYKCDIKELEDHIRIGTKINENFKSISCLLYINYKQSNEFLDAIEYVKSIQKKNFNIRNNNILN